MEHTKLLVILNNPLSFSPGHTIKRDNSARTPVGIIFQGQGSEGTKPQEKIATDLVSAYNNTYGAGIRPESVRDLFEACKEALKMYNKIQPVGGWQFVHDSLENAILGAKL